MTSSTILLLIYKPLLLLIVAHLPQFRRKKYLKNVLYFLLFSYITAPSKHLLSKCFPNLTPLLEVLRHLEPETHKDPEAHTHRFTPNTTDAHTQIRRNTHKHNHIHRPSPALWTHTQTQKHNHTQTHPQQPQANIPSSPGTPHTLTVVGHTGDIKTCKKQKMGALSLTSFE